MAANLRGGRSVARSAVHRIWSGRGRRDSAQATGRRAVHTSAYDKNPDEQVRSTVVPDDVIQLHSDKYWSPHPETGVFGPADVNGGGELKVSVHGSGGSGRGSVLEQTVWFRPLEVVDRPSSY